MLSEPVARLSEAEDAFSRPGLGPGPEASSASGPSVALRQRSSASGLWPDCQKLRLPAQGRGWAWALERSFVG